MDDIDLHTHSTCSDGTLTPRHVVGLAESIGLRAVALTDHDTVAGVGEALAAGDEVGIEVVAGVEISAACSAGSMHILGYYLSPTHPELLGALNRLQEGRAARAHKIVERLRNLGLEITFAEITDLAGGEVGRAHIAKALVKRRYVPSAREAFTRYRRRGRPGYVDRVRLPPEEVIDVIRRAGGLAALAHPSTLALEQPGDLSALVARLKAMGLEGMEVLSPYHTREMTRMYEEIAREHGLLCTGGSDFHGGVSDHADLGATRLGLRFPYALLDGLKMRIVQRERRSARGIEP
ncbi:MAG TPA: PHP domain-containing protein [Syntrophobacteria bacterium]|nr:PHP domain-containing protein [Syntrophobacteria bacterium]